MTGTCAIYNSFVSRYLYYFIPIESRLLILDMISDAQPAIEEMIRGSTELPSSNNI